MIAARGHRQRSGRGSGRGSGQRSGRGSVGAISAAVALIASAGALTACGSSASSAGSAGAGSPAGSSTVSSASSLATSLSTAKDSWAVVPVSANPAFWEVLVRPATSATWRLVTPPGIADNGGLVAATATAAGSLTVAIRPSQDLLFSPLAATADAGTTWSTRGPLSAGVAASPGALAAAGSELLAVLANGAIAASSNAGTSWRTIAQPGAIAASAAGKKCGAVRVSSVSFAPIPGAALAAGRCGTAGTAALFSHSPLTASGAWQRVSLPVSGPLLRLFAAGTTLVRAKAGLTVLWGKSGWYAYAPLQHSTRPAGTGWTASAPLPVTRAITASGQLAGDGVWVLLPGGQAATIAGPGKQWLLLPPAPTRTSLLAPGPDGAVDALAVSGATLTIWRLTPGATLWTKIQAIAVPIQYGSSS